MTHTKDEALKLAHGYLDRLVRGLRLSENSEAVQVLAAIKQALAAPTVQEPLTWLKTIETLGGFGKFVEAKPNEKGAKPVYLARPAQPAPVQEPFCFVYVENGEEYFAPKGAYVPDNAQPLYTTPPAAQRQWTGLTDDEIDDLYQGAGKNDLKRAREIEAKLKEKNT
jgi:hypothetical protein